jgi:hypothetical protein
MPQEFDRLDPALAAWGKYDEFPYKIDAARRAYEQLVALRGEPENPDSHGRTPFYIVDGGQYVAVRWNGQIGLSFQAGFITGRDRLDDQWVPTEHAESTGGTAGWWRLEFPDHVKFGKLDESHNSNDAECPCSPGLHQPIGSRCSHCDEIVRGR